MAYTARGLIDYARSVADLQNTKFISFTDELNLINEAYRDIYSRYTESDGDYYCTEIVIDILPSMADPNNVGRGNLIPLPSDFLKIRTLSYNFGGQWYPVQKFSMSNRDNNTSAPCYRLKNNTLWIIGGTSMYTQLKLDYYPIPQVITAPDVSIDLASAEVVTDYSKILGITYNQKNNKCFYIANKIIKSQDLGGGATSTILPAGNNIIGLSYFAGYLYWLDTVTKILARAIVNGTSTLSQVGVKTSVTSFRVQRNKIFYSTASTTMACELDGAGDVQVYPFETKDYTLIGTSDSAYVSLTNNLYVNGIDANILANQCFTDEVYLYWRYGLVVNRGLIVNGIIEDITTIDTQALYAGQSIGGYVSMVDAEEVYAMSLVPDTILDYPTNEANEIMAYTSAIAYARKQDDDKKMSLLNARLAELWERFWSVNKRDQYQNTRINNDYQNGIGNW
jgi:hypothetical protein